MALWTNDSGDVPRPDVRRERIAGGTVGGEHIQPHGVTGHNANAIIDDQDPRILYGVLFGGAGDIVESDSLGFSQNGTQTILGGYQSIETGIAATFHFDGTAIGVLGSTNPYSGRITVNVDGVPTAGRMPVFVSLSMASGGVNAPVVQATDTAIQTLAIPPGFPASGTILIGSELITYSSKATSQFNVSQRGANGTIAVDHYGYETVYLWANTVDLGVSATDYSNKRLLYYNPFLSPGRHYITVYNSIGASGYSSFYFDGFVVGSLTGAKNLFTQMGSVTVEIVTDANGHCDIGQFVNNDFDISVIGILGYSQDNTTTSNTTLLGQLGQTFEPSGQPAFYLHNGPPSSTFNLTVTFMYIGESL